MVYGHSEKSRNSENQKIRKSDGWGIFVMGVGVSCSLSGLWNGSIDAYLSSTCEFEC